MSKKSSTFVPDLASMSEQNHYIVDLSRLPVGSHRFDFQLDNDFFSTIEKSEILGGNVSAAMVLHLREEDYRLTVAVQGTVIVTCDRCLDPMSLDIRDEQEIFSEDEDEDVAQSEHRPSSNRTLDLSWLAYEIVCTNLPLVHCHPEGGCNPQMELLLQTHLCDEPEEPEDIIK